MVANGPYDEALLNRYAAVNFQNKVCFHREFDKQLPAGIYVPSDDPNMGICIHSINDLSVTLILPIGC